MSRYQFNDADEDNGILGRAGDITQILVRVFGFVLLIVGLWISLQVIGEAWALYKDPQHIERWAKEIERGSNLDRTLSTTRESAAQEASGNAVAEVNDALGFRMSYFVAWVIALMILMLVGQLAIAAVRVGGELALYDLQVKRLSRELLKQIAEQRNN